MFLLKLTVAVPITLAHSTLPELSQQIEEAITRSLDMCCKNYRILKVGSLSLLVLGEDFVIKVTPYKAALQSAMHGLAIENLIPLLVIKFFMRTPVKMGSVVEELTSTLRSIGARIEIA